MDESDLDYVRRMMDGPMGPLDDMEEDTTSWEWPVTASNQQHAERIALFRTIPYDVLYDFDTSLEEESPEPRMARQGRGLSLNVSSGGMLLLMDRQPRVNQVLKVHMPMPVTMAETPTLAEVRWARKLPFETFPEIYFVGLKFLLSGL
jgi:hypothetical protein